MSVAIVTGSAGLIGSEAVRFFHHQGFDVVGIDNHLRRHFFGADGDVEWNTLALLRDLPRFRHENVDVRDAEGIGRVFARHGKDVACVIHTAAQPSHDWAARDPMMDFTVNAQGTLVLLEATRAHCPEAPFLFTSTNKVYGDLPNRLPLVEKATRWEVDDAHPFARHGIDETMSIDQSMHSVFGASKVAADVMCQEYGRYFGLKTMVFRGGCLTGPAHAAAELHGFLAYVVKCALTGRRYTVYGYKGKQVRDNIHSHDLIQAFWHAFRSPRSGEVYNIGGSRHSNCSVLEAIQWTQELSGRKLDWEIVDQARAGDHIWWISDVRKFRSHFPEWEYRYDVRAILADLVESARGRE